MWIAHQSPDIVSLSDYIKDFKDFKLNLRFEWLHSLNKYNSKLNIYKYYKKRWNDFRISLRITSLQY